MLYLWKGKGHTGLEDQGRLELPLRAKVPKSRKAAGKQGAKESKQTVTSFQLLFPLPFYAHSLTGDLTATNLLQSLPKVLQMEPGPGRACGLGLKLELTGRRQGADFMRRRKQSGGIKGGGRDKAYVKKERKKLYSKKVWCGRHLRVGGQGLGQPDGKVCAMGSGSGSLGTDTPGGAEGLGQGHSGAGAGSHRVGYAPGTRPPADRPPGTPSPSAARNASSWFWRRSRTSAPGLLSPPVQRPADRGGRQSPGNPTAGSLSRLRCGFPTPGSGATCASVT